MDASPHVLQDSIRIQANWDIVDTAMTLVHTVTVLQHRIARPALLDSVWRRAHVLVMGRLPVLELKLAKSVYPSVLIIVELVMAQEKTVSIASPTGFLKMEIVSGYARVGDTSTKSVANAFLVSKGVRLALDLPIVSRAPPLITNSKVVA